MRRLNLRPYTIDLTFDRDGSLIVADAGRKLIRRIVQPVLGSGSVITVAGQPQLGPGGLHADGPGPTALFRSPIGLDFDARGDLFVADGDGIRRVTFASDGSTMVSTLGTAGASVDGPLGNAAFANASDVMVDGDGNLLVADGPRIRAVEFGASQQGFARTLVGSVAGFADGPGSVALGSAFVDLARGPGREIYAVDYYNRLIRRIRRR